MHLKLPARPARAGRGTFRSYLCNRLLISSTGEFDTFSETSKKYFDNKG